MDIKTDSEIEKQLVYKLLELGFSKSSLSSEIKTPYGKYIDLVALEFDKPKIVFEVKSKVMLQPALNMEGNGFRFHPAVRQAQLLAQEIKAPYFAVYDGEDLLWFEVDKNDGSPKLLEKPVLPISEIKTDRENSKTQILNLLFALADLGRGQFTREKYLTLVGLAILAKFWSEMGGPILEKILSTDKLDVQSIENDLFEHVIIENNKNKDYFAVAFSLLSNTSLSNVSSENLIAALDDYIQFNVNQFKLGEFRLPTWISEFTTSLAIVNNPKSVLDIYSNFGDSVVAAYKTNKETRVFSVSSIEASYIYDKLKRAILGLNVKDVVYLPQYIENKNVWLESKFQKKFSCVITTPPFGARVIGSERQRFQRSEELFLELSLRLGESNGRVICLVPENLLVSSRSYNFREYMREFAWINTIISLEPFLPSSSAMVSLLVLNKI